MARAPHRQPKTTEDALLNNEIPAPDNNCQFCGRELGGIVNRHHLVPLSKGGAGTPMIPLHKICHDKIHSVLSETELRNYYNTMERLRTQPELEEFIRWVSKKAPEFYVATKGKKK